MSDGSEPDDKSLKPSAKEPYLRRWQSSHLAKRLRDLPSRTDELEVKFECRDVEWVVRQQLLIPYGLTLTRKNLSGLTRFYYSGDTGGPGWVEEKYVDPDEVAKGKVDNGGWYQLTLNSISPSSFDGLEWAVNLEEVEIWYIEPKDGFIRKRHRSRPRSNRDINFLRNFTKLKRLYLGWNYIQDISVLASLKLLEEVNLEGNEDITDLTPMKTLHHLKILDLQAMPNIVDLSPLEELKGLKQVKLGTSSLGYQRKEVKKSISILERRGVEVVHGRS